MKKILIAEDDKFLRSTLRVKLQKVGFEVRAAANGEEAIKTLAEFTPDLILLDLVMPKKDGFTVLKELRASEAWQSVPILVASNLGQKEDIDRAMSLGATDYIAKTMTIDNQIAKINSLLG